MKFLYYLVAFLLFFSLTNFAMADCFYDACDTDGDGLLNDDEVNIYYTNPLNVDTDGDGYNDDVEINNLYSPRFGDHKKLIEVDSDQDGMNDYWELKFGTDLMNNDTDGDGYDDGVEMATSHDPLSNTKEVQERLIKVNIASQYLEYYFGSRLMDGFLISSGIAGMDTPKGQFTILDKEPVKHYGGPGYDLPNTKWNMHFTTRSYRYWIHGAYWHHNFGHKMSHGCVNVDYKNMEPLYDWSQIGTKVIID